MRECLYAGCLLFSLGFELGVTACGAWAETVGRKGRGQRREARGEPLDLEGAVGHLARLHRLTEREGEVFALLAGGSKLDDVAHALGIAPSTVRVHARNIQDKLGVCSNDELVALVGRTRRGVTPEQAAAAKTAPPPRRRGRPRKLGPRA